MNTIDILDWYVDMGVDACVENTPVNRFAQPKQSAPASAPVFYQSEPASVRSSDVSVEQAIQAATAADSLDALNTALSQFTGCSLCQTAAHLFPGMGALHPRVMCIIDFPKAEDDKTGVFLASPAGQMLLRMLKAIGLDYTEDTYIAPICPWRTPGDRPLSDSELEQCLPFLKRRIELVEPENLLLFGATVAGALLGINSIVKARAAKGSYQSAALTCPIDTFTTFAPSFLLKNPTQRQRTWEDLQKFQRHLLGI